MARTRFSPQRSLILEYVKQSTDHPTAEEIYQALKDCFPGLSRGTVYRNLNLLSDDGIIFKLPLPVERFDGFTNPHPHLICSGCGSVHDLKIDYDSGLDQLASESCGYQIQRHESFFFGLCPGCAADQQ
ncbi:MAG: transcriptional repressor [Oscillospiraceae bacterium]|nr:transcriptional repressor [Oscillospiraceae bacterium]